MADDEVDVKQDLDSLRDMHLKEEGSDGDMDMDTIVVGELVKKERSASISAESAGTGNATPSSTKRQSRSPVKQSSMAQPPAVKGEEEDTIGGGVTLKLEPGKPPKLARTTSRKVEKRPPQLFLEYEDKTQEATSIFTVLPECTYANKYLGATEHALECDCTEEWDAGTHTNDACGDDSDCINRATKMECVGDCGCGANCQNQRFQRKQYADVSVIKTEKKGHGLRTNKDLRPDDFIFEYIGEVIGENVFRRRMQQYDEEGIKHFYFMSLTKGEFVDATKRGNLGRFCNHSCNPNCYVDKWVVGDKLRMGIFAERRIQEGEELVFNYNVDRYGAEPQPCYCGEPNCTGYIGGKTQTDRATKLSNAVIEALGIDDADAWDTAVAKKPRKKKAGEDDEAYVNNVEPRGLDEDGVNKVMSSLMQCKEKWIAVKLLTRLQRADDEKVRNRVVRFHGYRILKTALSNFIDDVNICLQVLDILEKMPRLTRNKVQDSKIEETVAQLKDNEDERVSSQANSLLESWSKLEVAYRIPRMKRDPNAAAADRKNERTDRRENDRRPRSRSRSKSAERVQAPTGPRSNAPSRASSYFAGPRPPPRFRPPPPMGALPPGWFEATAANGSVYFYNNAGATTWQKPTMPATGAPPPPPPKAVSDQQMLQDLIKNIVSTKKEPVKLASATATPAETPKKERKEDKWRALPEEKQKKMYEGALQPHIMHVVGKYKHKLAKDDLKRWAKEFAKKMVDSDFKKGRVEDPTKVSDKQAKSVKKHAQDFFEKAVKKKDESDKRKAEKKVSKKDEGSRTPVGSPPATTGSPMDKEDGDITLSDHEAEEPEATPAESTDSSSNLKRRIQSVSNGAEHDDDATSKKPRMESDQPPPPPPPPPPPADAAMGAEQDALTPGEDVSGSFTHEAIAAVYNATVSEQQSTGNGLAPIGGTDSRPGSAQRDRGFDDRMQTATPPTTGSPYPEEAKVKERERFSGLNPDRMRQLGLMDGASD
ncbi:hypothetical protein LTR36_000205 [Oleoguttula mirabilis]|uniref:Histone-lysine N-methyltransferase, H3 lysine-36 specific n=1 Tax=Oleoguttula mirabilis TaxID=1507867 RepID=A0AAV9JZT5_9PEZI|nr:hypothetical protein LTR36_000205 [Oleoguttula mirabilis]